MSELTDKDTQDLRVDLEALLDGLREFVANSAAGSRPVALDEPIGRLSRMDALQQQSMAKANRSAAELRLQRVEAALRRIASDDYGSCLRCEEPVGFKRLKVQPEATLCIGCQSKGEKGS